MKLVVGLGNPGPRYAATRHNVGRRVVESLAGKASAGGFEARYDGRLAFGALVGHEVALLLPETFMNASGDSVLQAVRDLGIEVAGQDLLVVLDDLDLPFGRLRIRPAGSDGGQRGLRSVIDRLGTDEVPRLRFGVGRPRVGRDPLEWVLEEFGDEQEQVLARALPRAVDAVCCVVEEGIQVAMERFNGPFDPVAQDLG